MESQGLVKQDLTSEQIALVKSTIAKNATDEELKLFLYRCKNMGLDPLKPGQIHFVKYGTGPGTIVVGIDGFRSIAERTGKRAGTKRGVLRDDKGQCVGAWCEVYRSDWTQPAREEVSLKEYNSGKANWIKMPETMIKKVAEAAALRMAFPDDLSGVYSPDEMDQAESKPEPKIINSHPKEVGTTNKVDTEPGDYVIQVGRDKGRRIRDIDADGFIEFWRSREKATEPLSGLLLNAVQAAEAFVKTKPKKENEPKPPIDLGEEPPMPWENI